jgi:hypothetical protein
MPVGHGAANKRDFSYNTLLLRMGLLMSEIWGIDG